MIENNLLSIIVAAHNQWDEFTEPMMRSLRKYNPETPVVIVDNGSSPAYPTELDSHTLVIRSNNNSLAQANNLGIVHSPISKWYLTLNNDVIVSGNIEEHAAQFAEDTIYSNQIHTWTHSTYAVGWCLALPRQALLDVGLYDENFIKLYYDEVDYCYRAEHYGYKIKQCYLPIMHLGKGGGSRHFNDSDNIAAINKRWFLTKHNLEKS